MKTQLSAINTLYQYLIAKNVKALTGITGSVYQLNRPLNSKKEDLVINAVAMNSADLQEGVLNLNVHVPNLNLSNDDTQPDLARFSAIEGVLIPLLESVWGYDYNFYIDGPGSPVPDGKDWFLNIRIRFYTIKN